MKFNVGDTLVRLNLNYFRNPFHYSSCIILSTVKAADDYCFTNYFSEIKYPITESNEAVIFLQESGTSIWGNNVVYHGIKDLDLIESEIQKALSDYDTFCKENDIKRKRELLETIELLNREIQEIDKGNGTWKVGNSSYNNKQYKDDVLLYIKKKLSFFKIAIKCSQKNL